MSIAHKWMGAERACGERRLDEQAMDLVAQLAFTAFGRKASLGG